MWQRGCKKGPNIQGKIAFEKKQGCYGCHPVTKAGKVVGGLSGPSFVDAGKEAARRLDICLFKESKVPYSGKEDAHVRGYSE